MKRQPIASAAAFFVLELERVEIYGDEGECVGVVPTATDCIFYLAGV